MKPTTLFLLWLIAIVLIVAGCSEVERVANDVEHLTGGTPASQPVDPLLDAGRAVTQVVAATNPAASSILWLISSSAAVIASIAGHFNGKRNERKQAHSVISELVEDIAAFRNPEQPWTVRTQKVLADLGYKEESQPFRPLNPPR